MEDLNQIESRATVSFFHRLYFPALNTVNDITPIFLVSDLIIPEYSQQLTYLSIDTFNLVSYWNPSVSYDTCNISSLENFLASVKERLKKIQDLMSVLSQCSKLRKFRLNAPFSYLNCIDNMNVWQAGLNAFQEYQLTNPQSDEDLERFIQTKIHRFLERNKTIFGTSEASESSGSAGDIGWITKVIVHLFGKQQDHDNFLELYISEIRSKITGNLEAPENSYSLGFDYLAIINLVIRNVKDFKALNFFELNSAVPCLSVLPEWNYLIRSPLKHLSQILVSSNTSFLHLHFAYATIFGTDQEFVAARRSKIRCFQSFKEIFLDTQNMYSRFMDGLVQMDFDTAIEATRTSIEVLGQFISPEEANNGRSEVEIRQRYLYFNATNFEADNEDGQFASLDSDEEESEERNEQGNEESEENEQSSLESQNDSNPSRQQQSQIIFGRYDKHLSNVKKEEKLDCQADRGADTFGVAHMYRAMLGTPNFCFGWSEGLNVFEAVIDLKQKHRPARFEQDTLVDLFSRAEGSVWRDAIQDVDFEGWV